MKKPFIPRLILIFGFVSGLAIGAFIPSLAGLEGGITIAGADGTRTDLPASSAELMNEISAITPHFQIQFGESLRATFLTNTPTSLQTLLSGVGDHIQIQFAQSNRIVTSLVYPDAIIDDSTAPQVTAIAATPTGDGSTALITWTTNEFANSTVLYGTQSGNLNQTVSEALYNKNHSVTLTGLVPDTTYYFKVQSEDLEGNLTESTQSSFVAEATRYIYLPVITR